MATTLNIQRFIRSVRQGRTPEPVSCTAMAACTQQAFDALLAASWTRVGDRESGLPRHNWAQTGFSNRWDAAKYCGDYVDGYQHGYAAAVVYTLRLPADALAGTVAKIASVSIPVLGDRWLDDGCDVLVYLSASATPPAWGATADDSVTGQMEVVPANDGNDSSTTIVFDWAASPKTCTEYLHIVLKLTNYLTHRGAWIEGGAAIDGANIAVTFDRDVEPDTETMFDSDIYRTATCVFGAANYNPYEMHSTVLFRPVNPDPYGSESIYFYRDVVASLNLPTFKRWTYGGGVGGNINGASHPIAAGVYRSESAEHDVETFALASVFGRSTEIPAAYKVAAISFTTSIPAAPAGLVIRMAIYGATAYRGNCASSLSGESDYARTLVPPIRVAPSTAMNPSFWLGTATTMKAIRLTELAVSTDSDSPYNAVEFPITPLHVQSIETGVEAEQKIYLDVPWSAPAHAMIILAISVSYISAVPSPALTGVGTRYYGVNWFCPGMRFHLIKSVG